MVKIIKQGYNLDSYGYPFILPIRNNKKEQFSCDYCRCVFITDDYLYKNSNNKSSELIMQIKIAKCPNCNYEIIKTKIN